MARKKGHKVGRKRGHKGTKVVPAHMLGKSLHKKGGRKRSHKK